MKTLNFTTLIALTVLAAACDSGPPLEGEYELVEVDFGQGPKEVLVQDIEGEAVMDGDILLGPIEDVRQGAYRLAPIESDGSDLAEKHTRSAISHLNSWPSGRIPYVIDDNAFPEGHAVRARIMQAIGDWNTQTVVRLIPHNSSNPFEHYVTFKAATADMSSGEGRSAMGFTPGLPQDIRLGSKVARRTIVHEIGHTVGLFHEQNRADRDNHVTIIWNNVRKNREGNFYTYLVSGLVGLDFAPYDFNSIMHYGSFAFAKDSSKPTIVRADCDPRQLTRDCLIRSGSRLSDSDIAGVTRQVTGNPLVKYKLRNANNNRCLRPEGGSRAAGARVILSNCSNSNSRKWYEWHRPGTSFPMVINLHSRMCLERGADNRLVQLPCDGGPRQRFQFTSAGFFQGDQMRQGSRCAARSSNSVQPIMSTNCATTSSRRWFKDFF